MAIIFDPTKMLAKIAPKAKIKRMVSGQLSVKRTILANIGTDEIPIDNGSLGKVARKTLLGYKQRIANTIIANDFEKSAGTAEKKAILSDPKQFIQRIQNEIVYQVHQGIQEKYRGQKARWLPSSADEPRPQHQSAYGKIYTIGEGLPVGDDGDTIEPGDDWGCQCGVEILTDETKLDLG
jgi:hypothetical protein